MKEQVVCPVSKCDFQGRRKQDVSNHIRKSACTKHKSFYTKQQRLAIRLYNKGVRVAEINDKVFFSRAWINELIRNQKNTIKCKVCQHPCRNETGLKSHLAKQNDLQHQKYSKTINWSTNRKTEVQQCPICDHQSTWVKRHIVLKVKQQDKKHIQYAKKYYKQCKVCDLYFPRSVDVMKHMLKSKDQQHKVEIQKINQQVIDLFNDQVSIVDIEKALTK